MLAYVEQAPGALAPGPRAALFSMRLWAREMRAERCPLPMLRELLSRFGASAALWPAHNFFYWMLAHAVRPIDLGCPCCGRVSDDEALMMAAMFADAPAAARAALADLTMPVALGGAVRLAMGLGRELSEDRLGRVVGACSMSKAGRHAP